MGYRRLPRVRISTRCVNWGMASPGQSNDGLRLGRFAFAHRAHPLGGFEFHGDSIHGQFQGSRQGLADRSAVILQLGALQDYGGIDVGDVESLLADELGGVGQKPHAIGALPLRIGIGKMHSDIAQGGGAQQGVGDGVRENIGVGVALQPELAGDYDAAQDERPAGRDAVHIPAEASAQLAHEAGLPANSSERNSRAKSISEGLVILILRSLPCTTLTSTCSRRSTKLDSSVAMKASLCAASKARFSRSKRKTWGVWASTRCSRGRVARILFLWTRLTVSTGTMPTMAAPVSAASAMTLSTSAGSMKGRTASWTATRSVSGAMVARAFSTDCWRVSPPSTMRTGLEGCSWWMSPRAQSMSSARRATTISETGAQARNLRIVWMRIGAPSRSMNCLRLVPAFSRPIRVPRPAAGRITETFMRRSTIVPVPAARQAPAGAMQRRA